MKAIEYDEKLYSPVVNNVGGNGAYVGRWVIPSTGVNVACYASGSQATVDAYDSASYYRGYGHTVVGDHNNQGFNAIKLCEVGTMAYLETPTGRIIYTCVGKITGHNTGVILADDNYNSIDSIFPGTLVCYTCNDNWRNVTLVFFSPVDGTDYYVDEDTGSVIDPNEMSDEWKFVNVPSCEVHTWRDWEVVEESRVDYPGTKRRTCDVCGEREYATIPKLEVEKDDDAEFTEPTVVDSNTTECTEEPVTEIESEIVSTEPVDITDSVDGSSEY